MYMLRSYISICGIGYSTTEELIRTDTKTPEIDREGVPLRHHHFGRHVVRRTDDRERAVVLLLEEGLGGTQIDEQQLPLVVDHHILGLDVPVDDVLRVKVLHREDQ
jgi:hypothetical protein